MLVRRGSEVGAAGLLLAWALCACLLPGLAGPPPASATPVVLEAVDPAAPLAGPVLEPIAPAVPREPGSGQASGAPSASAPRPSSPSTGDAAPTPPSGGEGLASGDGAPLDPDALRATLRPLLSGGALGSGRTAAVVTDYLSAEVLYRTGDRPTTPASTLKLLTAWSALDALGPDAVLRTRTAILDPATATPRVVIVGGGDPTLASIPGEVGASGTSITPASLRALAGATKRVLGERTRVRVGYDDSLFTGPALHPTWSKSFPAGGVVAPVSALQVDQGRRSRSAQARVADPARAAAERFVDELERIGITVTGRLREVRLRADSQQLATVSSPPVAVLVERMLATSDNDVAEALARLAARASGHAASFAGVAARGEELLARAGVQGDTVVDGSGLSRADRLSPSTLTGLIAAHAGPLAPGLPVGGATGSLRTRYRTDTTRAAAGLVRAKTGTLTGVVSLAGLVGRPDGRLLVVALLDDSVPGGALGARTALDRAVAALVTCSCQQPAARDSGR